MAWNVVYDPSQPPTPLPHPPSYSLSLPLSPSLLPSLPQPYHVTVEVDSCEELTLELIQTKLQETRYIHVHTHTGLVFMM